MKNKTREFWIDTASPDIMQVDSGTKPGVFAKDATHVIEYASYETAIKERDEWEQHHTDTLNHLKTTHNDLKAAIKERDAARAELTCYRLDGPAHTERAKSAKLIEALKRISGHLSSLHLINGDVLEKKIADRAIAEYEKT